MNNIINILNKMGFTSNDGIVFYDMSTYVTCKVDTKAKMVEIKGYRDNWGSDEDTDFILTYEEKVFYTNENMVEEIIKREIEKAWKSI